MAINPVSLSEKVLRNYLKYQLTAYPFSDPDLYEQMRNLLNLDESRHTPLFKGPYVSLSRSFREGCEVRDMVGEGLMHPFMPNLVKFPRLYGHQEKAIRSIIAGNTTLVSTGTGSGKTECFLYPIISRCLKLRDEKAPSGIVAVLVYPMNALAEDQLLRLRGILAGTGITFGMYVGKTPEHESEVEGLILQAHSSRADYERMVEQFENEKRKETIHPYEERCSRERMRTPGEQPRILITNVKQLELLLTRGKDVELFDGATLEYLVFDEAHTYSGAAGAETACLIRRLRAFCGRDPKETVCIATSATIADPVKGVEAGKDFAARFFGVKEEDVTLVGEEYSPDMWASTRTITPPFPGNVSEHLKEILASVDKEIDVNSELAKAFEDATGIRIDPAHWQEELYERLAENEIVYQLSELLIKPHSLEDLLSKISENIGRTVPEEELLAWLALGAASRSDDRPLIRPVIHGFVRGVGGAMVSFPLDRERPRLWLSAEDQDDDDELIRLPVFTCTTCGQHYFEHYLQDFEYTDKSPGGGEALERRRIWRSLDKNVGGKRVILLDKVIGAEEDDDEPTRTTPLFICRYCGTAHPDEESRCDACGKEGPLVRLIVVQQKKEIPDKLSSCISCKARRSNPRGRWREPIRPVRAIHVADVHILAQDMVHNVDRRRLLVFADNRQDAAFQAGWMKDHARRFRLRAMMAERIDKEPVSVGDLAAYLDRLLEKDDSLSQALAPEVWNIRRKEQAGTEHSRLRREYLRIQVLREITTGVKQRVGLEPWGRMQVEYLGLDKDAEFIQNLAAHLNLDPDVLMEGIVGLLDWMRRGLHLYDAEGRIFSRFIDDGDPEIQNGFMPKMPGVPKGLKFKRESVDEENRITQIYSDKGQTSVKKVVKSWGVGKDDIAEVVSQLWNYFTDETRILIPVTLTGTKGRPLPGSAGAYQIDADKLLLTSHRGHWRCNKCRRSYVRRTPHDLCPAYQCDGLLAFEGENPDDYDLTLLDSGVQMLRPREHSAQVPADEREFLEKMFKEEGSEVVNVLVCTPTLELGVDIGSLDVVLMRNVPPLPSNYWQRVGRAGRRFRMAVNLTYCRAMSHDRLYFDDPLRMLEGLVMPPRFNMRNDRMVAKHVNASILTRMNQLVRPSSGLSQVDRDEIGAAVSRMFPSEVKEYLFDDEENIRDREFDISPLNLVTHKHLEKLSRYIVGTFNQGWPEDDIEVVEEGALIENIQNIGPELADVIHRLNDRLRWAMKQIDRLNAIRRKKGSLEPEQDALFDRCDRLVKRYKGQLKRKRRESEGYDDTITFAMLAVEGFLPGYGLDSGAIKGTAHIPRSIVGSKDFDLPRPTAIAVREYVPGNLIYANSHRFVPRYFHLEPEQALVFQVDAHSQAVGEVGVQKKQTGLLPETAGLGTFNLRAVPICDVELAHESHITDEEDNRFQLPVAVYGTERDRHDGGVAYRWGEQNLHFRRNVHFRLVNVGAISLVETGHQIGYPVCLVCGQSRSPFSSQKEREHFSKDHLERCGDSIESTGFYADIVADCISLPHCGSRDEAYSIMEALRTGASNVLDMETDDLQIIVIGHQGSDEVSVLLYDPMPGGSGLLDQIIGNFEDVIGSALEITGNCPAGCERSCVDCLWTYRNAFFHKYLDRKVAYDSLSRWGDQLIVSHEIPPYLPESESIGGDIPVNVAERRLQELLKRAEFPDPEWHHQIMLGKPLGSTSPDCFFHGDDDDEPGITIYLDGLSNHIHGNPDTAVKDRQIREALRSQGYEVLEIAASDLEDRDAMTRHFSRLARWLLGKDKARVIKNNPDWFGSDPS